MQLAAAPGRWRFSPPSPLFPDPWLRAELLGLETDQCPLPPLVLCPDSQNPPSTQETSRFQRSLRTGGRDAAGDIRAARPPLSVVSISRSVPCVDMKGIPLHRLP